MHKLAVSTTANHVPCPSTHWKPNITTNHANTSSASKGLGIDANGSRSHWRQPLGVGVLALIGS